MDPKDPSYPLTWALKHPFPVITKYNILCEIHAAPVPSATLALISCLISGNWLYFKFSYMAPEKGSFNIPFYSGLHIFHPRWRKTSKILIFPLPLSSPSANTLPPPAPPCCSSCPQILQSLVFFPSHSHCFLLLFNTQVIGPTIYLILSFQSCAIFTHDNVQDHYLSICLGSELRFFKTCSKLLWIYVIASSQIRMLKF